MINKQLMRFCFLLFFSILLSFYGSCVAEDCNNTSKDCDCYEIDGVIFCGDTLVYYPEWKENYSDFDKAVLMEERILGEKIGDVKRYKYDCFYMLPGFTPTIYTIKPNKNVEKLKLRLYIDENGVDTATDDYGKVKLTILKDGTRIYENNVVYAQPQEIELDLSNCNELQFIVDKDGKLSWDNLYIEIKEVICH